MFKDFKIDILFIFDLKGDFFKKKEIQDATLRMSGYHLLNVFQRENSQIVSEKNENVENINKRACSQRISTSILVKFE